MHADASLYGPTPGDAELVVKILVLWLGLIEDLISNSAEDPDMSQICARLQRFYRNESLSSGNNLSDIYQNVLS